MPKTPTLPIDDTQRFPVAGYEFRAIDYQQLQLWANALEMTVEAVVTRLAKTKFEEVKDHVFGFEVEDGAIVSLVWDYQELPLGKRKWKWVEGLRLRNLAFVGYSRDKRASLPKLPVTPLRFLWCNKTNTITLNLTPVSELQQLYCRENRLTRLDLTPVPHLTALNCGSNRLTELDLNPVPALTMLHCDWNKLSALDLASVPHLVTLICNANQLTLLDLSAVPQLQALDCRKNQLTQLDTALTPQLHRHCSLARDPQVQIIR